MPSRRSAPLLFALVLAVLLTAGWTALGWRELVRLRLPGPDDMMRLTQVRDWLGGQAFGDLTQYRAGPLAGTAAGWTRLPDFGPAGSILLFSALLTRPAAEVAGVVFWPELLLFVHLLIAARIARRLGGEGEAPLAILLAGFAWPATAWLMPGRIGAEGLQILLFEATALALVERRRWVAACAGFLAVMATDGNWGALIPVGLGVAAGLAAPVLAHGLTRLRNRYKAQAGWAAFGIALLLSPAFLPLTMPTQAADVCTSARAMQRLAGLPQGTLIAPPDVSAYALALTPHRVLALPAHPNAPGNRAMRDFFRSPPDDARYLALLWTADYVAFCPGSLVDTGAKNLGWQLERGIAPDWLQPVLIFDSPLRAWRVLPGQPRSR